MKHTLADPTKEWEGFRPTAYRLNPKNVCNLTLKPREEHTSLGQRQTAPVTVGKVLRSFADRTILKVEALMPTKITTDIGELIFDGPRFSCQMLAALADLRKNGIDGFGVHWFWYDRDSVTDQPQHSYSFFVVHKHKIVREEVTFGDYSDSGFDPSVFDAGDDSPPIWRNAPLSERAHTRLWYRRFYQETQSGQLMVLRDDEPELYYYPEGRWQPDLAVRLLYERISRIQSTLWITIILMALLAGILLWKL